MSAYAEFDETLGSFSGNAWLDDGVVLAANVLRLFGPDDWKELADSWQRRPEQWPCSAAYVLSPDVSVHAIPLLLEMVRRGGTNLRRSACDSLRAILEGQSAKLNVEPSLLTIVDELRAKSSGLIATSLFELRKHLSATDNCSASNTSHPA